MGLQKRQNLPKPQEQKRGKTSALTKAVSTHRQNQTTSTTSTGDGRTQFLDARTAAASTGFSMEDLALNSKVSKKAPTTSGMKTALAGESSINVERRVRAAAVPIGVDAGDVAAVSEELSIEGFDSTSVMRRLMPRRPNWSYELSSGRLHHREVQAFKIWLDDVRSLIQERGGYPPAFEQNLQVWRQLWRVLERCDVAVIVVDARHPLMHLPPALVYHATRTLHKPLVIVLNKLDAVEPRAAAKWAACLEQGIPGVSAVVGYSKEPVRAEAFSPLPVGRDALIVACHKALEDFASSCANTTTDDVAAKVAPAVAATSDGATTIQATREGEAAVDKVADAVGTDAKVVTDGVVVMQGRAMLGLVGHPNVGKSSLVNSLMGGKVVSVKATPGHTKTLQTMLLDERTSLCDSPGVVFPRLEVPRETQIVGMLIPISQVREPFSAIRWVMENATTPLPALLNVRPVKLSRALELQETGTDAIRMDSIDITDDEPLPWSPMLLCAQYATQRGFMNRGRPDCMKAGMEILERVLDGRVPYYVAPPETNVQELARPDHGIDSDDESDWEIDDDDFESEEEPEPQSNSIFEVFGVEEKGPGGSSIASRKKHARRQRLAALAEG
eukprot:TRINITY_DN68491_c0_g1_i1.p1 TRINITY_DN68491_c0_g1~~TRINITY_DN68491_c0_g1_i1.p1  ORF type:complete len:615 (+),score=115.38 TRINITY_DN68491_c0_g1_i1:117-1961(+)